MLFQFYMLATLPVCLSLCPSFSPSFILSPATPLNSLMHFHKLSSSFFMAVLKGLLPEGNGDEERHAGWFPFATYLRVMGLRKSDPREFIMRITNPLCESCCGLQGAVEVCPWLCKSTVAVCRSGAEYMRHRATHSCKWNKKEDDSWICFFLVYFSLITASGKCYDAVVSSSVIYPRHVGKLCVVSGSSLRSNCELFSSSSPVIFNQVWEVKSSFWTLVSETPCNHMWKHLCVCVSLIL